MTTNTDTTTDETICIREPTDKFHGFRVVNHNGTAFVEQIDNDGNEVQSMMFSDPDELDDLIDALTEVSATVRESGDNSTGGSRE